MTVIKYRQPAERESSCQVVLIRAIWTVVPCTSEVVAIDIYQALGGGEALDNLLEESCSQPVYLVSGGPVTDNFMSWLDH